MSRLSYGKIIDFNTVIDTKEPVSLFVPQTFPWEEEKEAEIILNDKYKIKANTQTKLLKMTEEGIMELFILLKKSEGKYVCKLPKLLEDNEMEFELSDGSYCDGTEWNQKDSTNKVLFCKEGMLSLCESYYWGIQYEFHFVDKRIRPIMGGKSVKIMRFGYCDKGAWTKMESVFRALVSGKTEWSFSEFNSLLRYVGVWYNSAPNAISLFSENDQGVYNWTDMSYLFR